MSPRRPSSHEPERILELYFDDNHALPSLFGPHNEYLNRIENALGVNINAIGNTVTVSGSAAATHRAQETFDALWERIQNDQPIEEADVEEEDEEDTKTKSKRVAKISVQRYKGLGEMNPEQLWDTTMDPATRKMYQISLEDAQEADDVFRVLMGEEVAPRRRFIQSRAKEVENLDI